MKKLFRQYTTFGKGDNEELSEQWADYDTVEVRMNFIKDNKYYDFVNENDFIEMKINELYWSQADDWDSPTGGFLYISSQDEALKELEVNFEKDTQEIKKLFKE